MRAIRDWAVLALVTCSVLVPSTVHAQSAEPPMPAPPPVPSDEGAVARPGQESGRLDDYKGEDSDARQAGQALLFVPKLAFGVVMTPARSIVYLGDRYHLAERARRWFFTSDGKAGAYPVVGWDAGFGPNIGVQGVLDDKLGYGESFLGKAVIGWASRATLLARFMSGDMLGENLTLGLEVLYDRNPAEWFYGIGNGNEIDAPPVDLMIDPYINPTAIQTRYFQGQARGSAALDYRPFGKGFHIRPGATVADVETSSDISSRLNDPPIDAEYDTMVLTGYPGYQIAYGEVELRLDTRRRWDDWESKGIPSQGWLVSVYGGRALVDVGKDYFRYGADIHKLVRLGMGPRVLALRFHGEGITGNIEDAPFTELPGLGGPQFLRGYNPGRFRDKLAAVASAEYEWDLSETIATSLFVDVGRVFPDWDDLSLDNMRVGFGLGIQAYTANTFLTRAQIASSIDGGVFLNLVFEPAFEPQLRVSSQ
ncbi:MAG: BamA/TamA family outer membrane protein [Kofleriaceae bacterium]|nr:BamA/TamA family outer membrane protein [Kofleriaceae bacterium]